MFVQTLAGVAELLKRVVQIGRQGVESVVVARAAELRSNLAGGLIDLAQLLIALARKTPGAGLLGQGFGVELDLLAFFQNLFVLVLFALDLHALERVEHSFVLLFGRRTAGALRSGRRNDEKQAEN